ncbi:V4R domain-containing protein [Deferrisoma palaeochoriense]
MTAGLPLRIDPEGGRLWVGESRYLLIRPETLAPVVGTPDAAVAELLREGGRAGGRLAAAAVRGRGPAGREAAARILAFGARIGWGVFEVEWRDEGARVTLRNSPFAEAARGRARGPVCHPVCGVLEGIWEVALGRRARFVETRCAALGAPACRFEEETS